VLAVPGRAVDITEESEDVSVYRECEKVSATAEGLLAASGFESRKEIESEARSVWEKYRSEHKGGK